MIIFRFLILLIAALVDEIFKTELRPNPARAFQLTSGRGLKIRRDRLRG